MTPFPSIDPPLSELRARVVASLRRRGLTEHDAQDCAQDVLVSLHRALLARPEHAAPEALALAIARTAYVDWMRRHGRRRRAEGVVLERHVAAGGDVVEQDPGAVLDVRAAVAALPEQQRVIVELSVRRGLTYAEIGETLGVPVGTVKSRMHHAMKRMRAHFAERGRP